MSRPTEFFAEDELVYWDVSIVAADGTALDADSIPTIQYRVHGNDTLKSSGVAVVKVAATTGLYRVGHNLSSDSDLSVGASIRYQETVTISGVAYVNRWSTMIRGVATLAAQTAQTSDIADLLVDTTAIDAKTSQLTFTVANQVDANSLTGGTSPSAVADAVWDEALSSHQSAGSTGKGLTDAAATGGDATAANQTTIIAKLTTPAVVYTNPSSPNKLTIIRGDAYDDATENNGKLTWATGKTLTGATVRFTIRDINDNILIDQTTAGVSTAVDSQTAEVSLTSAATALLTVATTNKFDAEAYWAADNRWTFARGNCTVLEDQTRS